MTPKAFFISTAAALLAPIVVSADVERGEGEPMKQDIGYGVVVNDKSSLVREWSIVNDENLPVKLTSVRMKTRPSDRQWVYDILYKLEVDQEVSALEARFIPFNIWGEQERTLSATTIEDLETGERTLTGNWRILSENDAVEHYAVLGYIAQVKLADGTILRANAEDVVEEARRFSSDFTSGDLELAEE